MAKLGCLVVPRFNELTVMNILCCAFVRTDLIRFKINHVLLLDQINLI